MGCLGEFSNSFLCGGTPSHTKFRVGWPDEGYFQSESEVTCFMNPMDFGQ